MSQFLFAIVLSISFLWKMERNEQILVGWYDDICLRQQNIQRFSSNLINVTNAHLATNQHDQNTCHLSGEMWFIKLVHSAGLTWCSELFSYRFCPFLIIFFFLCWCYCMEVVCHLYSSVGKQEIGRNWMSCVMCPFYSTQGQSPRAPPHPRKRSREQQPRHEAPPHLRRQSCLSKLSCERAFFHQTDQQVASSELCYDTVKILTKSTLKIYKSTHRIMRFQ